MMQLTAKQRRRMEKIYGRGDGKLVKDFIPPGRSGQYIYAVAVRQHPDKVKIGMTRNWRNRRVAYATWDLSNGDAITEERVFCVTEEFVDLAKLENHILNTVPLVRAFGNEWFFGTVDEAARAIDRIMCEHCVTYDL